MSVTVHGARSIASIPIKLQRSNLNCLMHLIGQGLVPMVIPDKIKISRPNKAVWVIKFSSHGGPRSDG